MTDTTVVYFDSTMTGAPSISGTAGTLIGVLDACLQDGFGSVTLDSLVVTDNVATATDSSGHGFTMQGNTGPVILIAGATPSGLNGRWRVTVTSTTEFTFTTTGISNQTATGTITAKRAPAGFTKVYSGTNKAVYRADQVKSTRLYLRVDDSPAQYPTLIMYETMSDVDTGTGASTTRYFGKSSSGNDTTRTWNLFADDRAFYLFVFSDGAYWRSAMIFGDIVPYRSGDAYHCLLLGHSTQSVSSTYLYYIDGTTTGAELARSYTQIGEKVSSSRYSHRKAAYMGNSGMVAPNPVNNALHFWPVECWESSTVARGIMPGLYNPIHDDTTIYNNIFTVEDRQFKIQLMSTAFMAAIDIAGPWR